MKANHNLPSYQTFCVRVVSNGSKILKWKQITTEEAFGRNAALVVSNGSKILKWKQITTGSCK